MTSLCLREPRDVNADATTRPAWNLTAEQKRRAPSDKLAAMLQWIKCRRRRRRRRQSRLVGGRLSAIDHLASWLEEPAAGFMQIGAQFAPRLARHLAAGRPHSSLRGRRQAARASSRRRRRTCALFLKNHSRNRDRERGREGDTRRTSASRALLTEHAKMSSSNRRRTEQQTCDLKRRDDFARI